MSTQTTQTKTRTITLTHRPPVQIREDEWPILAQAREIEDEEWDTHRQILVVRRHHDGRALVYAIHEDSHMRRDGSGHWIGHTLRRGDVIGADEDLVAAIRRVAADMAEAVAQVGPTHANCRLLPWAEIAQACIGDLPPEHLS